MTYLFKLSFSDFSFYTATLDANNFKFILTIIREYCFVYQWKKKFLPYQNKVLLFIFKPHFPNQNMADPVDLAFEFRQGDEKSIGMDITNETLHQSVKTAGRCRMIFSDLPPLFFLPL